MIQPKTNKAVILARGLGTRMRRQDDGSKLDDRQQAAADVGVKAMIPIDRPFLDYVLSALADAGFRRMCLVIGPEHDAIRNYYTQDVQTRRISIDFVVQQEPKGTADAVLAAEAFAGKDSFVTINSDNYYPVEALRLLHAGTGGAAALFEMESMIAESNIPEERLRQFAVGEIDGDGLLQRVIEKPDDETLAAMPRPLWLSMNCWRFSPAIFAASRAIKPSPRSELEITDAVQHTIDTLGEPFQAITVRAPVLDMTSRKDIAAVAGRLAGVEVSL